MLTKFACCICGTHVNEPEIMFQGRPICEHFSCIEKVIKKLKRQKLQIKKLFFRQVPPQAPPSLPHYIGFRPVYNTQGIAHYISREIATYIG